jgi:hypothetical protein
MIIWRSRPSKIYIKLSISSLKCEKGDNRDIIVLQRKKHPRYDIFKKKAENSETWQNKNCKKQ